ncbi:MAG TPA: nucleotidyltransferase family protein [Polyangiaceae bacterium]|jgi:dTDP-glucose pyrophosphorylase|nr:nucleotidyltransferase family protein [Polyangiaceae bacterium]
MWGIIPAAGRGTRIQPLAFSKELLPVGTRVDGDSERPMAVSEHLVRRMLAAGVNKLCFVVSPGKSDILEYYGGEIGSARACYVVQNEPKGLCDAIFKALPFIADDEWACVGLPDTIWFPEDGLRTLEKSAHDIVFLLFPVDHPEFFDVVNTDDAGRVLEIQVKSRTPKGRWIWGGFRIRGRALRELHELWNEPGRSDEYVGSLINAYIARGGDVHAVAAGRAYVDVGTVNGYREAIRLLEAVHLLDAAHLLGPDAALIGAKPAGSNDNYSSLGRVTR